MSWRLTGHKPYTDSKLLESDVMAQAYLAPASNSMLRRVEFRRRAAWKVPPSLIPRSTWRFNARITPIRANMVGPSCSATSISACIAACHSSASCRFVVCRHGLDVEKPQRHGDVDRIGTGPGISQIGPRIATLLAAVHEFASGHLTDITSRAD